MNADVLAWSGLILALGAAALWFWRMRQVRLPANRIGFVLAWAGGAALGAAALAGGGGARVAIPAGLALATGALLLTLVAISRQRTAPGPLRVGEPLPAFEGVDDGELPFDSTSLAGRPALIKLFRGHW